MQFHAKEAAEMVSKGNYVPENFEKQQAQSHELQGVNGGHRRKRKSRCETEVKTDHVGLCKSLQEFIHCFRGQNTNKIINKKQKQKQNYSMSREETLYEEMLREITMNAVPIVDCQRARVKVVSLVMRLLEQLRKSLMLFSAGW